MRGKHIAILLFAGFLHGCGKPDGPENSPPPPPEAVRVEKPPPVRVVDSEDRPVREARPALLSRDAFDEQGRLREEAVAASPERIRVLVEDSDAAAPASVTVGTLTLPLTGPPGRRLTRPILLVGDRDDAAAGPGAVLHATPGEKLPLRYRDADAGTLSVGPAVIHEIPVRFVAVGPGLPPAPEIEQVVALRLAQANAVWEPLGRRLTRGPVARLETFSGLFLIRGRAAGTDEKGRPSRCGVRVDGREIFVQPKWKNDGAPMTPKATANAWIAKAGKSFRMEILDGRLAGDRDAVVVRVRRPDGTPAAVEPLADGNDVAQAVTPLPGRLQEGIEVSSTADFRSLEEMAVLESGKGDRTGGFDIYIVTGLHSLQARPSFKVYPGGAAIVSWKLLDGTGRHPYGLARVAGEILLPPGVKPAPGDTLFADPISEAPGVDSHKRVTAATGEKIAERGRGLSSKK